MFEKAEKLGRLVNSNPKLILNFETIFQLSMNFAQLMFEKDE